MGETRLAMTSPVRKYASGFSLRSKDRIYAAGKRGKKGPATSPGVPVALPDPAKMRIAVFPTARQYCTAISTMAFMSTEF